MLSKINCIDNGTIQVSCSHGKPNLSESNRKQNPDQRASGTTKVKPVHVHEKEWIQRKTGQVKMD